MSLKSPDERVQEALDIPQAQADRIPPELPPLACKPIIRGGSTHGVVGNVKDVCEAREWAQLYARTPGWENLPPLVLDGKTLDRWLDSLEGIEVEKLVYPDDVSDSGGFFCSQRDNDAASLPYTCVSCGKPI